MCPLWCWCQSASFSTLARRKPGKRRSSSRDVASPTIPPPTIAISYFTKAAFLRSRAQSTLRFRVEGGRIWRRLQSGPLAHSETKRSAISKIGRIVHLSNPRSSVPSSDWVRAIRSSSTARRSRRPSKIRSINPAHPAQVVGEVASASLEQANEAIETAFRRFATWKDTSAQERAEILFRAADLVRQRRDDFNALLVLEVGKSWPEADADTAEAIDFMEFYGREALRYDKPPALVPISGEENVLRYIPLGVGIVIPPWNFAFAIMAGMTAAALVTGNTVVLKPSSDCCGDRSGLRRPPTRSRFTAGSGQLRSRVRDERSATRWSRIPRRASSRSRAAKKSDCISTSSPRRRSRDRSGSSASSPRWAAKIRSSSPPTPIWRKRSKASQFRHTDFKVRSARRARARSSRRRVYDEFLERLRKRIATIATGDPTRPETYMGPVINDSRPQVDSRLHRGRQARRPAARRRRADRGTTADTTSRRP